MRRPFALILLFAVAALIATSSAVRSDPVQPPMPTRPPGFDQPGDTFLGAWSSVNAPAGYVQIMNYPGQMIRIVDTGRFEAVGFAVGTTGVCLTSVPRASASARDSVRYGVIRLERLDAHTIRARFAADLASATALEETWTFRSAKVDRRPPETVVAPPSGALPAFGEYVYVEELPEAVTKVPPVYPDEARKARIEGQVMVQALVGTDGAVHDTRVVKSIPGLDEAAVAAVLEWHFKPAASRGQPVAVWVAVPVKFSLH